MAGECSPMRATLPPRRPASQAGLATGRDEVIAKQGRLGEHQPRLDEIDRVPLLGELGYRNLRGAARLGDEAGRQSASARSTDSNPGCRPASR